MDELISVCGAKCKECYCFTSGMCKGCNEHKTVVFHCNSNECSIYHCAKTVNGFKSCLDCKKIPCAIWEKTRDPKFTDEEFKKNTMERINTLKENQ